MRKVRSAKWERNGERVVALCDEAAAGGIIAKVPRDAKKRALPEMPAVPLINTGPSKSYSPFDVRCSSFENRAFNPCQTS